MCSRIKLDKIMLKAKIDRKLRCNLQETLINIKIKLYKDRINSH